MIGIKDKKLDYTHSFYMGKHRINPKVKHLFVGFNRTSLFDSKNKANPY